MKILISLTILIIISSSVIAETTFFEGDNMKFLVIENVQKIQKYCGDGICSEEENCKTCEEDCLKCKKKGSFIKNEELNTETPTKEIAEIYDNPKKIETKKQKNLFIYIIIFTTMLILLIIYFKINKKQKMKK